MASAAILTFFLLVGTKVVTSDAISSATLRLIHLSLQKKMFFPSPTLKMPRLWKTSLTSHYKKSFHGRRTESRIVVADAPCLRIFALSMVHVKTLFSHF
jgi:hypothetical protein